jgi:hypothetical protein
MDEPYTTLVEKLVNALKKKFGDKLITVAVFGSVARGDARKDSDMDLMLVIDSLPKSRLKRQMEFMDVEKEIKDYLDELTHAGYLLEFSPIIKTPEEAAKISPLYLDMIEDIVIVYDRGDFFRNVLEKLRNRLKKLGSMRVNIGKKWYWILKPDYRFGEVIRIG